MAVILIPVVPVFRSVVTALRIQIRVYFFTTYNLKLDNTDNGGHIYTYH